MKVLRNDGTHLLSFGYIRRRAGMKTLHRDHIWHNERREREGVNVGFVPENVNFFMFCSNGSDNWY